MIERRPPSSGLEARFFQTNSEGEFVEHLHGLRGARRRRRCSTRARGRTTRGRSTTRSRSPALPAVEVHLSDIDAREPWRRVSVIARPVPRRRSRAGRRGLPRGARRARARSSSRARDGERRRASAGGLERSRAPRGRAAGAELDALIVDRAANVRYLTGYTGSNGLALISAERRRAAAASSPTSATPTPGRRGARRRRSSARSSPASCSTRVAARAGSGGGRVGFDDAQHDRRRARTPAASCAGAASSSSPLRGLVERLRAVKDAGEIARIARRRGARRRGAARRSAKRGLVGPHRARGGDRARARDAPARRRARRASPRSSPPARTARCRTRSPREVPIAAATARHDRLGRAARRLLLGLHAHRTRPARASRAQAREVYELVLGAQLRRPRGGRAGRQRPRGRRAWRAR